MSEFDNTTAFLFALRQIATETAGVLYQFL
jgi:hypothetical protein